LPKKLVLARGRGSTSQLNEKVSSDTQSRPRSDNRATFQVLGAQGVRRSGRRAAKQRLENAASG
jgi:hypothetical protein